MIDGVDLWVELTSVGPVLILTGTYTLTLAADPACGNLPAAARIRTYTATVTPLAKPTDFMVTLSDAPFFAFYRTFGIQTAGEFVRLDVYRWIDEVEPAIVEEVEDAHLAILGTAPMSVGASGIATITVPFDGSLEYCPGQPTSNPYLCPSDARVTCNSERHTLTLTRR
jgi:hypothetical protein